MVQNSLKDLGWHINLSAIPELNPGVASANEVVKRALDLDLRQIADKASLDASRLQGKTFINGPLVLQLQKSLNIAVPKDQSESSLQGNSRRLLLLTLSDGNNVYQAVEMQPIRGLSMDTPPGAKMRLIGEVSIWKGFLQLFPNNIEVLGGNVVKLSSAWELSRQLGSRAAAMMQRQNQRQQTGPGGHGPPAFVPFGQQIPRRFDAASTDTFRAMDVVARNLTGGTTASSQDDDAVDEFSEQRQAAIAKALDQKQKQKPGDEKKLAIPDISQLTIASKPASAPPPKPTLPVAAAAVGDDNRRDEYPRGRPFGGRGRRGRGNYEDDYEAQASMGRPSQFRLFDVIQQQPGQEKLKMVAEAAAVSAPPKPAPNNMSSGRRYNDSGDGGDNFPARRGGGHWSAGGRGRGGGQSRTSYPSSRSNHGAPPPLFREGSAASSRGVDSASPLSDQGGRNGTGRELPPRLKRHQQQQQVWADESGAASSAAPQFGGLTSNNVATTKGHGRISTGGNRLGEFGNTNYADEDGEDYNGVNMRSDHGRANRTAQPPGHLLSAQPGSTQPSIAALYQPVVAPDGTTYSPAAGPGTDPALIAHSYAAGGYSVVNQQPQLHEITPFITPFVPGNVSSPPATPSQQQQQQQQASQSSSAAASVTTNGVVDQNVWRPNTCCLARWTDGSYYPVLIISVDPQSQTAFVNYYQYNECQNVPLTALHPLPLDGNGNPAALPQPVLVTMLPPHPMQQNGSDLLRQQQQRMMWIPTTGSPLLPPPPPFPGEEAFANRLSVGLPLSEQVAAAPVPAHPVVNNSINITTNGTKDAIETAEDKIVDQPPAEAVVPLETAVAAG